MIVKLLCPDSDRLLMHSILERHHLIVSEKGSTLIVHEDMSYKESEGPYDLIIEYQSEKINVLNQFLSNIQYGAISSNIIIGKCDEHFIPLDFKDIVYFNASGNYTYVNIGGDKSYRINEKLYQLEDEILPNNYIRINKSEIVNIYKITQISPMLKGNLLIHLAGYKTPFDISRNYTKDFKERLGLR